LRAVAHALISALAAVLVVLALAPPAGAAEPDVEPTNDMVFEVFPHVGAASNFWDSWGSRRSGGRRHKGVDILGQRGAPVVAVADGVVVEMGKSRQSGYFIRIQHTGDWMTVMMHLNNDTFGTDDGEGGTWSAFYPTLMVGDPVTAGQPVGYIGDSGNAEDTTPHTHFELRYDGKKVNPYPYLVGAWRRHFRLPLPTGSPEAL
jgi:murein DD-endopeptidase MepM/ murein hydrolase activator NlpD